MKCYEAYEYIYIKYIMGRKQIDIMLTEKGRLNINKGQLQLI